MSDARVHFAEGVDRATLAGWLRDHFSGQARAYRLGMRPDDTDLDWFEPGQAAAAVDAWPQGRVFDRTREIRWEQRSDGAYAVWVLGEPLSNVSGFEPLSDEDWTVVEGRLPLFLWGRFDRQWTEERANGKSTWIEVRIPRPLHHPARPPAEDEAETEELFARLGHIEYRAPNGAVQFTRLTEVK